jgi:ABC-type multidrug transport system fused ATPase/permease subunit
MTFSDTRATATDLQRWVAATDPRSSSAGVTYEEQSTNRYQITMTFSVAATAYPQVFSYLAGYAQTHHGTLNNLHESVQDVSNDYVDTTSRLKNLRTEQDRLLALLSQAKSLSDTLAIEQRLTDVEGQIEQIEAHLNALNGQTTFYMVTITLTPVYTPAPDSPSAPWNPGQTFHDALTAALGFGQGLVSVLIWLATFAIYIIPVVVIFLLVRRWRRARAAERPAPAIAPAVASAAAPSPPTASSQPPTTPTS